MNNKLYMHQETGLPAIDFDGVPRLLGRIPDTPALKSKYPRFRSAVPMVPRSSWWKKERRRLLDSKFILDQKNHGSCVGFGSAGAVMRARALTGQSFVKLSGAYIYSFINGGRDSGAMIGDAMDVVLKGTVTDELVPWDDIYPSRYDVSKCNTVRVRFRAEECYRAESYEEIVSGILMDYIAVFAVMVGGSFTNLDSSGICGFDRGPGNHCVHGDGVTQVGSEWVIDMPNSWGTQFGQDGRGYITQRHIESVQQDCYLIKTAVEDPEDTGDDPPEMK
jgi:hypothetical protein